jgi:formate hydrogenlyase transcriptional activator
VDSNGDENDVLRLVALQNASGIVIARGPAEQRSEAYLAEAQRLSHTGSFGWRPSTGEIIWSEETFRIFQYDPTTTPTVDVILQRVHPEEAAFVRQTIERASWDGKDFDFEHRLRMPDGSVKHLRVVGRPSKDESGSLEFVGAVMDVSERKQAEEKIREQEVELRQILDVAPQHLVVLGSDGSRLYINQVSLDFRGLTLEEWQKLDTHERFHPDDAERVARERKEALSSGSPLEIDARVLGHDGKYRWFHFCYKPLKDQLGRITRWIVPAIDIDDRKRSEERLQHENVALREEIDKASMFEEIVGTSPALHRVLSRVSKVAATDSTVLILGETGTGKELISRAIHKRSHRSERAFIRVNCAAIPQSLMNSELFGHEKGAFTGATQRRLGRFEAADGGTLFLDEAGEIPMETQIALLRVLQEREFERVGGNQPISVDVRVIAATNRDLKAAVADGRFRRDLFYRLNVFPIEMPALRERIDDIPLLVEYLIDRYGKKTGKRFSTIRKNALEMLQAYDWPGNIRELQNVVERAAILCDTDVFSIDETWLKREFPQGSGPAVPLVMTIADREREIIEAALAESGGRVAGPKGAAAKLGIPRQTLDSKIAALGVDKRRFQNLTRYSRLLATSSLVSSTSAEGQ